MKLSLRNLLVAKAFLFLWILGSGIPLGAQADPPDGKLLRGEVWQEFRYPGTTADFYVSPQGNDAWSGTLAEPNSGRTDGPFATVARAQKAVRELKSRTFLPKTEPVEKRWIGSPHPFGKGKDILVLLRGGCYALPEPLLFSPEDGGERIETNLPSGAFEYHHLKDHYVTYASYPGEKAVLSGGTPVPSWTRKGNTWTAPFSGPEAPMLVVNGEKQILARSPNRGYFRPAELSKTTGELLFRPGEIRNWPDMADNRVVLLLRWHIGISSIARVDPASGTAFFKEPQPGIVIVPPRYYVENVPALLDAPGEWFWDRRAGEISYIPAEGIADPGTARPSVPRLNRLVELRGTAQKPVRNLRFYGLQFEAVSPGPPAGSALRWEYAHGCELVDSWLQSCGGAGVTLGKGCYRNRLLRNRFRTIDQGGIAVVGQARPAQFADIIRENRISYNRLSDCGGLTVAVSDALFTTISHNLIHATRGSYALSLGGWSNLEEAIDGGYRVEYNHLYDVQRDADDSGAIRTAGMTYDSVIRRNLVHDVHAGYFNDNVGFWFDNMSSNWIAEENIFYNLGQGEMKLCAANLTDNTYRHNYRVEAPAAAPEEIIDGEPRFSFRDLEFSLPPAEGRTAAPGSPLSVAALVYNQGSTGILPVYLYLDGKVAQQKPFPVIRGNGRRIQFDFRVYEPGEHQVAIGTTGPASFVVKGSRPLVAVEDLRLSDRRLPLGETVRARSAVTNLTGRPLSAEIRLFIDGREAQKKVAALKEGETGEIEFAFQPPPGSHTVRIENGREESLSVFPLERLDLSRRPVQIYGSAKAAPFEVQADVPANRYRIQASGSDFYHAEDSYATAFLEKIQGDFVATVKISRFGSRTHEWFRAGLFVRNDLRRSFDIEPGSLGSMLVFATPGRAGIEYDEFGNGCMHKADSQNMPENTPFPVWLKLVRRGDRFSGHLSYDGINWVLEKKSVSLPGVGAAVDLGLAAGSCDKQAYWVEFSDWTVEIEKSVKP